MGLTRLGKKLTKRGNSEAKLKNQSTFFKPNNFKSLETNSLLTKNFFNKFTKKT